jgi:general secretion pathway protein J
MRWQSPPLTTRGQVDDAWRRADAWAQDNAASGGASEVAITGLQDWQVFYFRADAWTNPLSSDATQAAANPASPVATGTVSGARTVTVPDGVRIVLTLPAGQAITGELTRDWVRPTVGGGKSS